MTETLKDTCPHMVQCGSQEECDNASATEPLHFGEPSVPARHVDEATGSALLTLASQVLRQQAAAMESMGAPRVQLPRAVGTVNLVHHANGTMEWTMRVTRDGTTATETAIEADVTQLGLALAFAAKRLLRGE